jgi:hypothetical protein
MVSKACLLLALAILPARLALGQVIDGATNPEQIPDEVAMRLFFGAVAGPPASLLPNSSGALLTPTPRQAAKLSPIQLNAADVSSLLQAVGTWQVQASTRNGVAVDLDLVTQGVVTALKGNMSQQGYASLLPYVQSQKKYMKRVQVPGM